MDSKERRRQENQRVLDRMKDPQDSLNRYTADMDNYKPGRTIKKDKDALKFLDKTPVRPCKACGGVPRIAGAQCYRCDGKGFLRDSDFTCHTCSIKCEFAYDQFCVHGDCRKGDNK